MTMDDITGLLNAELRARTMVLNAKPLHEKGQYVLIWLQQTLRGNDHPTIDAGVQIANALGLPALVYHGLREDYPYASDRLHYFILGASREMARELNARQIAVAQNVVRPGHRIKGLVYQLADQAAAVVTDRHATFVASWQATSFAAKTERAVIAVDATRLVPHELLTGGLTATKAFREAHSPLRDHYLAMRMQVEPQYPRFDGALPFVPDRLADLSEAEILALISTCAIDHSLPPSAEYLPSRSALDARLKNLITDIIPKYKATRNNPADPVSCSGLSPYLHFGMTSPFEILRLFDQADIAPNMRYKFCDELLTWREWCHWRMTQKPQLIHYDSLPSAARKTMEAHQDDPRSPSLPLTDLIHGNTPDETWNAAQRQWLATGWMHNNLRMYWAKQIIKWTPSPQAAWATACYLNDRLSLDGRDPATYVMMRWAFGEARPGYAELPIYGWISTKSDSPLRNRPGANGWLREMANRPVPQIDSPSDYGALAQSGYW